MNTQVCKSFIQPANGGAQSWSAGAGLSKISVDTEAVAIGNSNSAWDFQINGEQVLYLVQANIAESQNVCLFC